MIAAVIEGFLLIGAVLHQRGSPLTAIVAFVAIYAAVSAITRDGERATPTLSPPLITSG